LDRDGTIGRLRVHWPAIDPKLVRDAQQLQKLVWGKSWNIPQELQEDGTEILEMTAGVGHSAFANHWLADIEHAEVLDVGSANQD
jgi:hypothetical protein